jgi:putative transposase
MFYSLKEAQVVVAMWQKHYNTRRPQSSLGYRALAPMSWIVAAYSGGKNVGSPE